MKRGSGPKQKGASWERDVCRRLSLWVTNGKLEDVFWRSSMSGGRATVHRKRGKNTADAACGDICAIRPQGRRLLDRYFIECKATVDLMLDAYLYRDLRGKKDDHWIKPCKQAKERGLEPLVILKRNRMEPVVYVTRATRDLFNQMGTMGSNGVPRPIASFPLYRMYVYSLTHLLDVVNPRTM